LMPRIQWPLLHHRPIIEVVLSPMSGHQPLIRRIIADSGAGTAQAGFGEEKGRVDLGGRPPRPPTDPDVRVKRIWLFIS
jgi:hypothetical protein